MGRFQNPALLYVIEPSARNNRDVKNGEDRPVVLKSTVIPTRSPYSYQIIVATHTFCTRNGEAKKSNISVGSSIAKKDDRRKVRAALDIVRFIKEISQDEVSLSRRIVQLPSPAVVAIISKEPPFSIQRVWPVNVRKARLQRY